MQIFRRFFWQTGLRNACMQSKHIKTKIIAEGYKKSALNIWRNGFFFVTLYAFYGMTVR